MWDCHNYAPLCEPALEEKRLQLLLLLTVVFTLILTSFWPLNSSARSILRHFQPSSTFVSSIYHFESFLRLRRSIYDMYMCTWVFFPPSFFNTVVCWFYGTHAVPVLQISRLKSALGHSLTSTQNDGSIISLAQL